MSSFRFHRLRQKLRPRRKIVVFGLAAAVGAFAVFTLALAASVPGSNFEIDNPNANLKVDGAAPPALDWGNVTQIRKAELFEGADDDSFGQGSKEDTPVPTVVDGSIPPNKSDLKNFGVFLEQNANGRFLNVYWHRVQDPSGTTNMDFEFNKSSTLSGNGVTPVRTAGDVLIQYDLSQGGVNPVLFISRWVTTGNKSQCEAANAVPCWSTKVNLSQANDAVGAINTTAIPAADADGLGAISPRTFGEASIDFDAIASGGNDPCASFGSAYLKSRSSDSFTAALKDFIAPVPVNISNCGSIEITKTDDASPANPLKDAVFTLYKDNAPVGGSRGAEDTITTQTCTTGNDGKCTIANVLQGEYWVVETTTPAGHDTAADQHATVTADTTVKLTFVDPRQRGAIEITKTRKHAAAGSNPVPHAGVDFTVNGVTKTTGVDGKVCFENLLFGQYTVRETVPVGYKGEGDKTVTVNNKAGCSDSPYGGETVSFVNTPLTDLTVSVNSQVTGGTNSKITCTSLTPTPPDATPNAFDDVSETVKDLEPGTYTCTVVIDP